MKGVWTQTAPGLGPDWCGGPQWRALSIVHGAQGIIWGTVNTGEQTHKGTDRSDPLKPHPCREWKHFGVNYNNSCGLNHGVHLWAVTMRIHVWERFYVHHNWPFLLFVWPYARKWKWATKKLYIWLQRNAFFFLQIISCNQPSLGLQSLNSSFGKSEVTLPVEKSNLIPCICNLILSNTIQSLRPVGEQRSTSKSKAWLCCSVLSLPSQELALNPNHPFHAH